MSYGTGIKNEELNFYWDRLHDIEETFSNTPFSLASSEMNAVRNHLRDTDHLLDDDSIPIKIVVTGRMNAGKSMMADVLFFDGEGILSSDTIPATANITYIRCTDEQHKAGAKVTFLTESDVEEMQNYLSKQSEDGKSDDSGGIVDKVRYKATEERLSKINADSAKRDSLLGKDTWIKLGDLKQYSDVGGEFSDFVNQIEVYIDDPRLKNLTIVDTPGLGDPVVSRSQKARDESRTAEVIFYLSRASHFMDMEDADEFSRLKKAGCKNMVLIMSQFDEVCDPEDEDEFSDLEDTFVYNQLASEGKRRIKEAMARDGVEYEAITIIPICALGAKMTYHRLEADDDYYRNNLTPLFRDWDDHDVVYDLAGIKRLSTEVDKVSEEKEQIREQTKLKMVAECRDDLIRIYQSLKEQLENDIKTKETILSEPDKATEAQSALEAFESSVKLDIKDALSRLETKIDNECDKIKGEITGAATAAKQGMESAKSPDSINSSYELTFKNHVQDMFENGIAARLSFDTTGESYGEMFDIFRGRLHRSTPPEEIAAIRGLSDSIYGSLQTIFESEVRRKYRKSIQDALPLENIISILAEQYKTVRLYSPDYKYKKNPMRGRAKKNSDAIAGCKGAIDRAEVQIFEPIDNYSNNEIRTLFKKFEEKLNTELSSSIGKVKDELNERDEKLLNNEINERKSWLSDLEELNLQQEE